MNCNQLRYETQWPHEAEVAGLSSVQPGGAIMRMDYACRLQGSGKEDWPEPRVKRRRMGASRVVIMTRTMMAEKRPSSMTPMLLPMPAKMRPTSPRGIMPMPTAQRFMEEGQPK